MELARRRYTGFLLRLPENVRDQAIAFAEKDGISLNQFVSLAVAEKLAVHEVRIAQRDHAAVTAKRPAASFVPTRPH